MSNYDLNIVALDTETGGLNGYVTLENGQRVHGAAYYPLIELAFILPTVNQSGELDMTSPFTLVVGIKQTKESLSRCHPWALEQHTKSGLFERLETGEGFNLVLDTVAEAEHYILNVFQEQGIKPFNREERTGAMLIGNNINFDFSFLDAQMPKLAEFFHYRKIDVSAVNVLSRSLWTQLELPQPDKVLAHTALSDIQESIVEMNGYTRHLNARGKA